MKKVIYFLLFVLFFLPTSVFALSENYQDVLYDVVGKEKEEGKVNIYFFYGNTCPHCAKEEKFLDRLEQEYSKQIRVYRMETFSDSTNKSLMIKAKELLGRKVDSSVPFTVMGDKIYSGYNDYVGTKIETELREFLEISSEDESIVEQDKEEIPFLGEVDIKEVSVFLVAIIFGLVDGFNPCAMWILLFLINMLFGMKNKKRMFLLGFWFLFISALVYFLSMLGITAFLSYISIPVIRTMIGLVAVVFGMIQVRKYLVSRHEEVGCQVVDEKKRKKIFARIRKFTTEKNLLFALIGVSILAVSVNLVELACSTVFPATFAEILAVNQITGIPRILYLLLYTFFYMLDDLVVFVIAVSTLSISSASSKYGKYSSLLGGIIMLLVGVLLIFKPEWIMFRF